MPDHLTPTDVGAVARAKINAILDQAASTAAGLGSLEGLVTTIYGDLPNRPYTSQLNAISYALTFATSEPGNRVGSYGRAFASFASIADLGMAPSDAPAVPSAWLTFGDAGRVARVTGASIVATRLISAIEPGRVYRARWAYQRRANTSDPSNDTVRLGIAWLDQGGNLLSTQVVRDDDDLKVADGRREVVKVLARAAGRTVDIVSPSAARSARLFVQTFGVDGRTDIEILGIGDVTDATVLPAASADLAAQVAAQTSLNLGPRVGALEAAAGTPLQEVYRTLTDARAGTPAVTTTTVLTLGAVDAGDGVEMRYRRTSTNPGVQGFVAADGSFWVRADAHVTMFVGSGLSARIFRDLRAVAVNEDMPDIGAQFAMESDVGHGNVLAYKIGLTAFCLAGPSSAPAYAMNTIVQGYAGPGGYLVTGYESDLNQLGAHADTLASDQAAYGFVAVAAGYSRSTAAYWATAATASWNYGYAITNYGTSAVRLAGFYDKSNSSIVFRADGTHDTLLDGSGATLGFGVVLPNNIPAIAQKDGGGTLRTIAKVDAVGNLVLGEAGLAGIQFAQSVYPNIDNTWGLGGPSNRFANIFVSSGLISTSDAALKTPRRTFTDAELDAWGDAQAGIFQWLDAVAQKGAIAARLHAGYIAQEVASAFAAHGLDASRYGLWCSDPVTVTRPKLTRRARTRVEQVENRTIVMRDGKAVQIVEMVDHTLPEVISHPVVDEFGEPVMVRGRTARKDDIEVTLPDVQATYDEVVMEEVDLGDVETVPLLDEAGQRVTRLGLRYEQCAVFEAAWQRRRCDRLEAEMQALAGELAALWEILT